MLFPHSVGIKALEIYVPSQTLDQAQFEAHQGVSAGKYTIVLGLKSLTFCKPWEAKSCDQYLYACSLALTAVSSFLCTYSTDPQSIGRLEAGTESLVDKAKSIQSVLTQLFGDNHALRSWDGQDAIVVASDIAIYKDAAARPTGGAGCVAIPVGLDAPICCCPCPSWHIQYMTRAYDFYKPDMKSKYPLVDGQLSISCYLSALNGCYKKMRDNNNRVLADTRLKECNPNVVALLKRERQSLIDVQDRRSL